MAWWLDRKAVYGIQGAASVLPALKAALWPKHNVVTSSHVYRTSNVTFDNLVAANW